MSESKASPVQLAKANGIKIWYETFGEPQNPALLLVMGGLCQGILWPTDFCEQLAREGFYVIRYDHRDCGLSTCFTFEENPYDLFDMAKDAMGLLDYLQVDQANVCGLSMGGPIAELMSVHFPNRIATLTLIATSCDLRPSSLSYDGLYPEDITLSRPKKIYLDWMQKFLNNPPQTEEEHLEERVIAWAILNGSITPFDEGLYREIHREFLNRLKYPESLTNHLSAIKRSFEMIQAVPWQVRAPALVIHGSEDPIFPQDHGEALHAAIANSHYLFVQGLGHVVNRYFYDFLINEIKHHIFVSQ